jgi:ketosteroid isomerase-like protein
MTKTEDVIRKYYSEIAQGNRQGALDLLDANVSWTEAENSPYFAGELSGVDVVVEGVVKPIGRDFEGFAGIPEEFLTQGDRTAVFGTYTGRLRLNGRPLRAAFVHLWTVRNGRIVAFRQFTDTVAWAAALAGLFNSEDP